MGTFIDCNCLGQALSSLHHSINPPVMSWLLPWNGILSHRTWDLRQYTIHCMGTGQLVLLFIMVTKAMTTTLTPLDNTKRKRNASCDEHCSSSLHARPHLNRFLHKEGSGVASIDKVKKWQEEVKTGQIRKCCLHQRILFEFTSRQSYPRKGGKKG